MSMASLEGLCHPNHSCHISTHAIFAHITLQMSQMACVTYLGSSPGGMFLRENGVHGPVQTSFVFGAVASGE